MNELYKPTFDRRLWQWLFAITILGLLTLTASSQFGQISHADFQLRWGYIALAVLCLLITVSCQFTGWSVIIRQLAPGPWSLPTLVKIFSAAWAARYVPFGVTPFLTKFFYGRRIGINTSALGMSMVLENIFSAAALFLVAMLTYPAAVHPVSTLLVMATVVLTIVIIIWPKGLLAMSNWLLVHLKQEPFNPQRIRWQETTGWLLLYGFGTLMAGSGFFFLLLGLLPAHVPFTSAVGLLNAAAFVGFITVIAPAGLGAREASLAVLLLPWFSWPVCVVLAAAARLLTVAVDGIWLAVVLPAAFRYERHTPTPP